ncbi:MAG: hypothetical protein VR69_12730 [Peptococcaceae bacterium BRH_c4b]|nr:MAG: hypothetical protein VR69_12730 [Peptococcaceae bacterium BRH_c4b]
MNTADYKDRLADYLQLYVVTDDKLSLGRPEYQIAAMAAAGGAGVIQLRDKHAGTLTLLQKAGAIRQVLAGRAIFIINDRVDVVLAVNADGVHLGQEDMPLTVARDILGPEKIIGVSVGNVEEALRAEEGGADYLGASAVFSTPTKTDAQSMGLQGLEAVCRSASIPVVGIGGINIKNARQVIAAGAAGVAVVSAVVSAPDVVRAASELLAEVKRRNIYEVE